MWMVGTPGLELSRVVTQGVHEQEAASEVEEPGPLDKFSDVGCHVAAYPLHQEPAVGPYSDLLLQHFLSAFF